MLQSQYSRAYKAPSGHVVYMVEYIAHRTVDNISDSIKRALCQYPVNTHLLCNLQLTTNSLSAYECSQVVEQFTMFKGEREKKKPEEERFHRWI